MKGTGYVACTLVEGMILGKRHLLLEHFPKVKEIL